MGLFEPDESIFRTETPLREDYEPEDIEERDEEISEYVDILQPVMNGDPPKNIFAYGKTGVGKSEVTKHILQNLKEDADKYEIDISTAHISCENLTSSYQVAVEITNELREDKERISETGYPEQKVFNLMYEEIDRQEGTVLIVLDEIDNIGENDKILYGLPRAVAKGYVESSNIGVIGISNDLEFRENLSAKVRDTLAEEEIHFPPYDANELKSILSKRAEKAFYDDVLNEDVIPLCAALAARDSGSARQALELLNKAGDIARRNEDDSVTEEYVRKAQKEREKDRIEEGIENLTTHAKLTLLSILDFDIKGEVPVRNADVYPRYKKIANKADADTLSKRRIHDHLSQLSLQGILNREKKNIGRQGGSYYIYELNTDMDLVLNTIEQDSRLGEIPSILREKR
ncbi:MAG: orc1/cdc6 family replication initiation protein [Halobacteria archaeon]|nr:orc1/cdc6 family replication initiation protein [Halobacteria archaeon]